MYLIWTMNLLASPTGKTIQIQGWSDGSVIEVEISVPGKVIIAPLLY